MLQARELLPTSTAFFCGRYYSCLCWLLQLQASELLRSCSLSSPLCPLVGRRRPKTRRRAIFSLCRRWIHCACWKAHNRPHFGLLALTSAYVFYSFLLLSSAGAGAGCFTYVFFAACEVASAPAAASAIVGLCTNSLYSVSRVLITRTPEGL